MKKYPVHRELKLIANFHPPVSPAVLPVSNAFLRLFRFRADTFIQTRNVKIERTDGSVLSAVLVSPAGAEGRLPCLVYFHGGGFMLRAAPYHYRLIKEYAKGAGCRVLFIDYRLAPRNPFPAAAEDAYCAYAFARSFPEKLGIDPGRIAVGGDSAGGCLAAGCAMAARDRGFPPCFQLLIYPVLDRRMQTDSMEKYRDTPMWNTVKNRMMWKMYLPESDPAGEYASPGEAKFFEGLPPAYIETAEFDCLHDEGAAYANKLRSAGICAELNETKGTVHGFDVITNSRLVKQCIERRIAALKNAF